MRNLAQLYLLAALAVSLSLAAGMSPRPPSNRDSHPIGDLKLRSQNPYYGIVLATDASGLRKRQTEYSAGCPTGHFYVEDVVVPGCYSCPAAHYLCPNSRGCCPNGIEYIPGTIKCRKSCDPGSTQCYDFCCPAGYSCIAQDEPCLRIKGTTTLASNTFEVSTLGTSFKSFITIPTTSMAATSSTTSVSSSTTIPTPKATTSSTTLVSPFTTTPISSTSTTADSEPTSPSMPEDEHSSSSTESVNTSPTSSTTAPTNGENDPKQGRWLGGFLISFFFVCFYMCSSKH